MRVSSIIFSVVVPKSNLIINFFQGGNPITRRLEPEIAVEEQQQNEEGAVGGILNNDLMDPLPLPDEPNP